MKHFILSPQSDDESLMIRSDLKNTANFIVRRQKKIKKKW